MERMDELAAPARAQSRTPGRKWIANNGTAQDKLKAHDQNTNKLFRASHLRLSKHDILDTFLNAVPSV